MIKPLRDLFGSALGAIALFGCVSEDGFPEDIGAEQALPGAEGAIDLSQYERTFSEDFGRLDVSDWGCRSRWIAHTPYAGDFGDARFADPTVNFPFIARRGLLRIEAKKTATGGWETGNLSSQNPCGTGFTQQYGYFEARIKLPEGLGTWPSFWMLSNDTNGYRVEVDVLEFYGHKADRFQAAYRLHPLKSDTKRFGDLKWVEDLDDSLTSQFNTYGVSIEEDFMVFYLNRREHWRVPTPDEFKQPMYMLVTLALGSGYPIEETPNPTHMFVDYVHVYKKKP